MITLTAGAATAGIIILGLGLFALIILALFYGAEGKKWDDLFKENNDED
jgi:nitrogen fixation-related uncharacterized protein